MKDCVFELFSKALGGIQYEFNYYCVCEEIVSNFLAVQILLQK